MTLGYISAFSETLAMGVIVAKGVAPLLDAYVREPEDHITSAAAWSLGQIGRHSPEHAKALAVQNVFAQMLAVYEAHPLVSMLIFCFEAHALPQVPQRREQRGLEDKEQA